MKKHFISSELEMKRLGENIKLARTRRHMSGKELSVKASVSRMALMRLEKGDPTVGIGKVFNVLSALGLLKGLSDIASPELDRSQALKEIKALRQGIHSSKTKVSLEGKSTKIDELDF
jgi:transcriptional regulator with XRE-family HTH domain